MVLVGVQPSFMQVPPINLFSTNAVFSPCFGQLSGKWNACLTGTNDDSIVFFHGL
jgi:hypothetical protein